MRKKAWVIKGRRHANRVVNSCVTCRKNKAKACQQVMGDLPPERITPARPFEFTTVDLFGPYKVKDEAKKRTQLKVWGIVFCCMASRAIQTDIVSDQSSEGFLLAYHRFTALRGHPKKLWSDPGTNFVGARPALKELYEYLDRLNKQELEENAAKNGTEWSWKIHPANSPHRNGAAEAAVRLVKRALHNLGGDGVFTWSEFQTLLSWLRTWFPLFRSSEGSTASPWLGDARNIADSRLAVRWHLEKVLEAALDLLRCIGTSHWLICLLPSGGSGSHRVVLDYIFRLALCQQTVFEGRKSGPIRFNRFSIDAVAQPVVQLPTAHETPPGTPVSVAPGARQEDMAEAPNARTKDIQFWTVRFF
ncbi:hypothetical protein WMY93_021909 [Mugilogobius chulae]|uniref:Integrase catalytic domain-containing protein n=1 Tax=Mugilogobius chulae TaxID=88201 RepID=A0AAW0NM12_9GOBI